MMTSSNSGCVGIRTTIPEGCPMESSNYGDDHYSPLSILVDKGIGYANDVVTKKHYIAPGPDDRARKQAQLKVLEGDNGNHGNETWNIDPMTLN
jgi:hypothetical protein